MQGYLKLYRNAEGLLADNQNAFLLFMQIALRAWRGPGLSPDGLQPGQAKIGDYQSIGLTRRQYRNAVDYLEKHMHIFVAQKTNRGTVVCIKNSYICDINVSTGNEKVSENSSRARNMGQQRGQQRGQQEANKEANKGANRKHFKPTPLNRSNTVNYGAVNLQKNSKGGQLKGQLNVTKEAN